MGFMDGFERGLSGNYRYEIAGKAGGVEESR